MSPSRVNDLTTFISSSLTRSGFSKAVIAMSGGVDSSTSAALTVKALGAKNVYPLLLPYGDLNSPDDANLVISHLSIPNKNITTIDIKPAVDSIVLIDPAMDNIRRGNIMARIRMIYVFDVAKKKKALVVGTENKTEHLLGYYTRFGDEGSDIEPLRNLYKTDVYTIAQELGLPEVILTKPPTAGLWKGQTDEDEFGFTYKDADHILSLVVDKNLSEEKIVEKGVSRELVQMVLQRMKDNEFKHHLPFLP